MQSVQTVLIDIMLFASSILASPVQPQQDPDSQARTAVATTYEYTTATPIAVFTSTASCPSEDSYVTQKFDCPSGCIAAPVAGMLGINPQKFRCKSPSAVTSWSTYKAMSTCEAGSTVTTYTLWGGERQEGCHATAA